jgi:hypothetical protein
LFPSAAPCGAVGGNKTKRKAFAIKMMQSMIQNKNLFYGIGAILVVIGAVMKILHIPHASTVFIMAMLLMQFIQGRYIKHLENKLMESEQQQQSATTRVPDQSART